MKWQLVVLTVIVAVLVCSASGEKVRKHKKFRHGHRKTTTTSTTTTEPEPQLQGSEGEDVISMLEDDEAAEGQSSVEGESEEAESQPIPDPCIKKHCGAGRICQTNEEGEAECVCIPNCPSEIDPRRKVCTNHNETFGSDCEVYRMRCWCATGSENCRGETYEHVHIEYYGECRDIEPCSADEMADFPRRMRDWLFNIMRDLADRKELTPHYLTMEREAEENLSRKWVNAAVWKWCELDGHPHDRSVSRHELFPIRAPLMSLEHCIAPFLDACDENDDHRINLKEWGKCLGLGEDDIEEKCDDIRDNQ